MPNTSSESLHTPGNWEERFRAQLLHFCDLTAAEGVLLSPFSSQQPLKHFKDLPDPAKAAIVQHFEAYVAACIRAKSEGAGVRDEGRVVLWSILRDLGLRPCSDLFSHLSDGDVIEVYGGDFIQLYRNLHFLELCTYPLDEIFSCPWTDLFSRPQHITEGVLKDMQTVLSGKVRHTICMDPSEHIVEEVCSTARRKFRVRHGILSPLIGRSGQVEGLVASLKASVA